MWEASFHVPVACRPLVPSSTGWLNVGDILLCSSCVPALGRLFYRLAECKTALGCLFYGVAECGRPSFMYQLRAGACLLVLRIS